MSNLLEVAKHALQAMEDAMYRADTHEFYNAKESLRQAIEQAEQQEPVAWMCPDDPDRRTAFSWPGLDRHSGFSVPLYTTPPQRKPLTDEEADELIRRFARYELLRAIERAHGIGGGE